MRVRSALALLLLASWDSWRLLMLRIEDEVSLGLVLVLAFACFWGAARADREMRISTRRLALMIGACATTTIIGPALLQIGTAVVCVAFVAWHGHHRLPRTPLAGLVLLALPILPTLDFLLAYPLRRTSAMLTVALLRLNGIEVGLQGVALDWHGKPLLFDGPCSGVRMLWAALLLASLLALLRDYGPLRYVRTLFAAIAATVTANAIRAASLFYVENGLLAPAQGPWMHEAVGLVAFALLAACLVAATPARRWRKI